MHGAKSPYFPAVPLLKHLCRVAARRQKYHCVCLLYSTLGQLWKLHFDKHLHGHRVFFGFAPSRLVFKYCRILQCWIATPSRGRNQLLSPVTMKYKKNIDSRVFLYHRQKKWSALPRGSNAYQHKLYRTLSPFQTNFRCKKWWSIHDIKPREVQWGGGGTQKTRDYDIHHGSSFVRKARVLPGMYFMTALAMIDQTWAI